MALSVNPDDTVMEDEDVYASSEDEDFNPTAINADENIFSSSEADSEAEAVSAVQGKTKKTRRRKDNNDEAEDLGFENSGDEATIKKGMKRKRKAELIDEDSGGEGGFVKTRSMREVEEKEKTKPLASTEGATVDIDALWKEMNIGTTASIPIATKSVVVEAEPVAQVQSEELTTSISQDAPHPTHVQTSTHFRKELITIPFSRVIDNTSTEVYKTVLRSSDEAHTYLKSHPHAAPFPRSIPRRRISKWDPNPSGIIRGLPSDIIQTGDKIILLDMHGKQRLNVSDKSHLPDWPPPPKVPTMWEYSWRKTQMSEEAAPAKKWKPVVTKEQKMNVVDKSKMDWVAHVEQEGDKEELEAAAKAKGAYLDKVDFLLRTEDKKEEQLTAARLKK